MEFLDWKAKHSTTGQRTRPINYRDAEVGWDAAKADDAKNVRLRSALKAVAQIERDEMDTHEALDRIRAIVEEALKGEPAPRDGIGLGEK